MLGPGGAPLAREYVCPSHEKPLDDSEIERGYEADGKLVVVSEEELERLAPRRSRDIELTRFVERGSIPPAFFERPYVLVPGGEQSKAYLLLAEVMESTQRAAIASFVMRGKAYAVAIFADDGILRAETLRHFDELRDPSKMGIPAPAKADPKRVATLTRAISKLEQRGIAERELSDSSSEDLLALARKKLARGEDVVEAPETPKQEAATEGGGTREETADAGGEVIDLLALIQQRLRESGAKQSAGKRRAPPRARR